MKEKQKEKVVNYFHLNNTNLKVVIGINVFFMKNDSTLLEKYHFFSWDIFCRYTNTEASPLIQVSLELPLFVFLQGSQDIICKSSQGKQTNNKLENIAKTGIGAL